MSFASQRIVHLSFTGPLIYELFYCTLDTIFQFRIWKFLLSVNKNKNISNIKMELGDTITFN